MDVGGGGELMGRDSWNGAGWHGLTGGEAVEAVDGEGRWPGRAGRCAGGGAVEVEGLGFGAAGAAGMEGRKGGDFFEVYQRQTIPHAAGCNLARFRPIQKGS